MYHLKSKSASKEMRSLGCTDGMVLKAFKELQTGLVGKNLGGNLFKKRIAIPGKGKSGGLRTIIATKRQDRWIVVACYAKNQIATLPPNVEKMLKVIANVVLDCSDEELQLLILAGEFIPLESEGD